MLYPVIIIIAFLTFGLQKARSMYLASSVLTIILLLVFFNGIIDLLHFPSFYINLLTEVLVLFLLVYTYSIGNRRAKSFHLPGIRIFFMFSIILIISVYINESNLYQSYLYYRFFLTPFLFMLIIVNMNLTDVKIFKLVAFVEFLFVFQLIATIIKLVILGRPENPVGTIIIAGGGVATFLPLIAAGFLLSKYYILKKDKLYLYLLFAFPLIAFASQKRGTFIFLPVVFILFIYFLSRIDARSRSFGKKFKYLIFLSVVALILLIFASMTTRTMNPEESSRGSFDISYLFESSVQYNSLEGEYSLGRYASFNQVNKYMSSSELKNKLFGYGPETLKGATRGDGRFEEFGVAGTYPGISYQFIQIGFIGGILWLLLYLYYGFCIYQFLKKEKDKYWKSIGMGSMVLIFVFFIDYITYSVTFITVYAFTFTIAIAFGLIMKRYYIIRTQSQSVIL